MFIPYLRFVCLTFVLSVFSCVSFAEVYKWTDKNKQINYSQQPPANVPYSIIGVSQHPASDPNVSQKSVDDLIKQHQAEEKIRLDKAMKEESDADRKKRFEENCVIAKDNLLKYQNNPGRRMIDAQGNVTRPTEEERQQKIKDSQDNVNLYCK